MMRDDTFARLEYLSPNEPAPQTGESAHRRADDTEPSRTTPGDGDRGEPSNRPSDDREEPTDRPSDDLRARMMRDDTFARLEYLHPTDPPPVINGSESHEATPTEDAVSAPEPDELAEHRQHLDDAGPTVSEPPNTTGDITDLARSPGADAANAFRTANDREQPSTDDHGQAGYAASTDTEVIDAAEPEPSGVESVDPKDPARNESVTQDLPADDTGTAAGPDEQTSLTAPEDGRADDRSTEAREADSGSASVDDSGTDPEGRSARSEDAERDRIPAASADPVTQFELDSSVNGEQARDRFERWDPERAGLPRPPAPDTGEASAGGTTDAMDPVDDREMDKTNAVAYIAAAKADRPWLEPAANCDPIVQNVYTSVDMGDGHGHIRHGAMGDDELYARRVAFNEDPAQTDPVKRSLGTDGLDPSKEHYCGKESTRIHDANAFATAYVGATENSDVRATLEEPSIDNTRPDAVAIPIAELLGPRGHELCSGFTLKREWPESKKLRKQWIQARNAEDDLTGAKEPEVERIPAFEGGDILVAFKVNPATKRHEISTLYPQPRDK